MVFLQSAGKFVEHFLGIGSSLRVSPCLTKKELAFGLPWILKRVLDTLE